ncbi:hypothetical protein [Flavobacterium ginsenosidimutans]|uniref:Uncharacterized protein n=1 Tax=Flavobacterium ginsenosidimutans TaxID=687844 RepID=A0ABZ2QBW6_9FLAO|nr:hypothetical protein [Flavobacterium ginsenosidimutans]KAF2334192.1 hypothetical protein DM444_07180 [Flavobacterium ginsenosidimutans]
MKLIRKQIARFYKHLVLLKYYSKKIDFSSKPKKTKIIICFDGNLPHGGLVDRLKGIISLYEISKILDFEFKIFFTHPFELTNFLEPNLVDWIIKEEELKYNVFTSKIVYLINDFTAPLHIFERSKAKTFFVYCNVDYLAGLYPTKNESEIKAIWKNNYSNLFKTSNYLQEKLNVLSSESRIAFHTRFTTLMGDFSDSTKKILSEKEKFDLTQKVIKAINNRTSQYPDKVIYVFSDSDFFLNYVRTNTSYKTLAGVPKHIENNNSDLDYHSKTFLDFYYLAGSELVFLVAIDQMYYSSFSKYAAIIGEGEFKSITN